MARTPDSTPDDTSDTPSGRRSSRRMTRREKWRYVRNASKRRVRGGEDLAPVPVQHAARRVDDVAHVSFERVRRFLAADRGLWIGLAVMVLFAALVLSGPVQAFVDQRGRVELAQQQLAALEGANGELEQRAADLTNPDHIEVLAREQLGYARPGQLAYSLVPPEGDEQADQAAEVAPPEVEAEPSSWWSRFLQAFKD